MALPDFTDPVQAADASLYKANIDAALPLNTKILDIGDWDMSSATGSASANVVHGVTFSKIRSVSAVIRNDAGGMYDFNIKNGSETGLQGLIIGSVVISLWRGTSGEFDGVNFNATSYNRGWVVFKYTD